MDALYRNRSHALIPGTLHGRLPRRVGGVRSEKAITVTEEVLIPITIKANSEPAICETMPTFNERTYRHLLALATVTEGCTYPLRCLISDTLYRTVSIALFGPSFPVDSCGDFKCLDTHSYQLFAGYFPAPQSTYQARQRLAGKLTRFMKPWKDTEGLIDFPGVPAHGNEMVRALVQSQLPESDVAALLTTYVWGIHTNMSRTLFWLLAHLAVDRDAYERLREAIDVGVKKEFKDLAALLDAHPSVLNGPTFRLLDSAIKETNRLYLLPMSFREVIADFDFPTSKDGSFSALRGNQTVANIAGVHWDGSKFEDPLSFRIDRFLDDKLTPHLYIFGKGQHICPGRHLAVYVMKMFTILCLYYFEILPQEGGTLPEKDPCSLGMMRSKEDMPIYFKERVFPDLACKL
ncbi:hypothetical protein EIP86_010435 [Pleurotus ostreatoroseus]|nr:hypothetical protein EIP86_010435 [Pleurotus ostreatoroseus]